MDIIEDRHQKSATIITSQAPVKAWLDAIGEKTVADAILDGLAHRSLRVELYGESIRKMETKNENSFR
jgi:DNA replication protein DnaC